MYTGRKAAVHVVTNHVTHSTNQALARKLRNDSTTATCKKFICYFLPTIMTSAGEVVVAVDEKQKNTADENVSRITFYTYTSYSNVI